MESQKRESVEQLIKELEKRFGGLRKAAEGTNTNHARLGDYRAGPPKLMEFIRFLERSRKALKMSPSAFWNWIVKMVGEEKK